MLSHNGNLLWSDEPKLSVVDKNLLGKIPFMYTFLEHSSKQVAELAMDVNTGEIFLNESTPATIKEIEDHVQYIYKTHLENNTL